MHEAITLMVFDVGSGKRLHSVAAAPGVLAPGGKCLLSWAGVLRRGRLVELEDGETRSLHGLAWARNVATAFHPDLARVALVSRVNSSRDPTVQVQVFGNGDEWPQPLSSFELSYPQLDAGSFSPDLASLLARTRAGHFDSRDITTGETRWTHVPAPRAGARLHCSYPTPPLYSTDGSKVALWWADFSEAAGDQVASVTIVDTSAGAARVVIQLPAGTPQLEDWSDAAGVLIATGPDAPPVVFRRR